MTKATSIAAFQESLFRQIPLAQSLGVTGRELSDQRVVLTAPLELNINYNMAAFGGSVYSVAVLSCWALVGEVLKKHGFEVEYVVIQTGHLDYAKPVEGDFIAEAKWPGGDEGEKFLEMLRRRGRGRVGLKSTVSYDGIDCAFLDAKFVAQLRKKT